MSKCNNCNCICHCGLKEHSDMYGVCSCTACSCGGDTIHELAKANPDKNYREVEQLKAEQNTYEQRSDTNTGGLVIDDTGECEGCG